MNEKPTIDLPPSETQSLTVREAVQALDKPAEQQLSPLDLEPAVFKAGLERRKANRGLLMDWVRSALVEGTDFGKIHTAGKDKCRDGRNCKISWHWSKPVLFKPGAEKICGMLGVTVNFPTLPDYEQAALRGVEIKTIILKCQLLNGQGAVIAEGIGGRSVAKDYGDVNKSLKMAEKSGHIDAVLRMAGLSEIFTQDLEDEPPPGASQSHPGPPNPQPPPKPKVEPKAAPGVTEAHKARLLERLDNDDGKLAAREFFEKVGAILPNEELSDLPLSFVPLTAEQFEALARCIHAFVNGEEARLPYPQNPVQFTPPAPKASTVPPSEGAVADYDRKDAPWRFFPMPWGARAGTPLADLDKNYLFGLWANFTVETEYQGRPKRPESIAKDQQLRDFLDEAGKHYKFTKKD